MSPHVSHRIGFALCQETEGLDQWHADIAAQTSDLLKTLRGCETKLQFADQVAMAWSNAGEENEKEMLLLGLLNMVYLNSYSAYERSLEDRPLAEISRSILGSTSNPMQYEVESLVRTFCRHDKRIVTRMIDHFCRLLNERIETARGSFAEYPSVPRSSSAPISPMIVEYVAACLREQARALYCVASLLHLFLEDIATKQRAEYLDTFTVSEFQKIETELIPTMEKACLAAFAMYWTLCQPVNNPSSDPLSATAADLASLSTLSTSLSVSSAVAVENLQLFVEACESGMLVWGRT